MASNRDRDRPNHLLGDDDPISMVEDIENSLDEEGEDNSAFIRRVRDREREKDRRRTSSSRAEPLNPDRKPREPALPPASDPPQGQGRIAYYRSLQGFLQAIVEAAPLYMGERRRNPHMSEEELRQHVASQCRSHLNLVDHCLTANNANTQDILLRYIRRAMAKSLAGMYLESPVEDLEGVVEIAKAWVLESTEFENALAENSTGDSILGVKLSLFTASLKSYQRLDGLWCGHEPKEVVGKLQKLSVELCKDVAFSWSKRSQISDRENLFSTMLPHCLEVLEGAYRQSVMEELDPIEYLPSDPLMPLPLFETTFENLDMGYEDEAAQALISRVRGIARGYLDGVKTPQLQPDDSARWKSNFIAHIDGMMAEAWNEAGSDLIDELSNMSDEDKDAYLEEHNFMEFSRFESSFKNRLGGDQPPFYDIIISFDQVMDKAKHDMAWIWGISDSLIVVRKEQLPED